MFKRAFFLAFKITQDSLYRFRQIITILLFENLFDIYFDLPIRIRFRCRQDNSEELLNSGVNQT